MTFWCFLEVMMTDLDWPIQHSVVTLQVLKPSFWHATTAMTDSATTLCCWRQLADSSQCGGSSNGHDGYGKSCCQKDYWRSTRRGWVQGHQSYKCDGMWWTADHKNGQARTKLESITNIEQILLCCCKWLIPTRVMYISDITYPWNYIPNHTVVTWYPWIITAATRKSLNMFYQLMILHELATYFPWNIGTTAMSDKQGEFSSGYFTHFLDLRVVWFQTTQPLLQSQILSCSNLRLCTSQVSMIYRW